MMLGLWVLGFPSTLPLLQVALLNLLCFDRELKAGSSTFTFHSFPFGDLLYKTTLSWSQVGQNQILLILITGVNTHWITQQQSPAEGLGVGALTWPSGLFCSNQHHGRQTRVGLIPASWWFFPLPDSRDTLVVFLFLNPPPHPHYWPASPMCPTWAQIVKKRSLKCFCWKW